MGRRQFNPETYADELRLRSRIKELKQIEKESTLRLVPAGVADLFRKYGYFAYYSGGYASFRKHSRSREKFLFRLLRKQENPWEVEYKTEHYYPMVGNMWRTVSVYHALSDLESKLKMSF